MKYHYVYKVTNDKTGEYYKGKHSTDNIDDGYLGSSKSWKSTITKYGKSNFSKEIVSFHDSEDEAYTAERVYITEEDINNPLCFNAKTGGRGVVAGRLNTFYGKQHTEETKYKISEANTGRLSGAANPQFGKTGKLAPCYGRTGASHPMYGKHHTDEAKQKISEATLGRKESDETRARKSASMMGKNKGKLVGSKSPRARAIRCLETGVVYGSITEAAAATGLALSGIRRKLRGTDSFIKGLHWEYV